MRYGGGSAAELGADGDSVLPAMGLQQGEVVNRMTGHEDEFATATGLDGEFEVAGKTPEPAHPEL